ncbi:MAG: type II toxin-antitoxin system HipA family toxin [Bacteroidales bacterium]|nr:type II toxin-antitoxin system HipA family toxin [Bacteroidales bacterium]
MKTMVLKVMLWGREMGRLMWDTDRKTSYFIYNPEVIGGELDMAPLVAPVTSPQSRMPYFGEEGRIYQKLPSFLADSLPDDWGNQLFEFWRTSNKIPTADITPLEKLSFIGSRGMGALEFEPEVELAHGQDKVNLASLVNLAQRIFVERSEAKILPEESLDIQSLIAVGTSAGGRQPKAVVAIGRDSGEIRSGQVAGLEGYDYCILKFGDPARSSAELEMTYHEMAVRAGIDMMPSRLIEAGGQKHFLTQRYDRRGSEKLHVQTLAAMWPEADSYDKLLWVCRKLRLPEQCSEEIFRRMVFNVLANNTDDHNKNFSFTMDSSGKWGLSQAYDLTYVFNTGGYLPQDDRCLSINGKLVGITRDDALLLAKNNGIRGAETIIDEVAEALGAFRPLAEKNGVRQEWIGRVETTILKHLEDWGLQSPSNSTVSFEVNGHKIENVYIEEAYRGNYHLWATIDGKSQRFVIRKKTEDHAKISDLGLSNVSETLLRELLAKYIHF